MPTNCDDGCPIPSDSVDGPPRSLVRIQASVLGAVGDNRADAIPEDATLADASLADVILGVGAPDGGPIQAVVFRAVRGDIVQQELECPLAAQAGILGQVDSTLSAALQDRSAANADKERLLRSLESRLAAEHSRWQELSRRLSLYEERILVQARDHAQAAARAGARRRRRGRPRARLRDRRLKGSSAP